MNSGHVTSQSLNCFLPRIVVHASPRSSATFWPYGEKSKHSSTRKMGSANPRQYYNIRKKGIRTNENRGKQCKTHGKYRTVANMQSKSKVYIFRPFTDLGTPPHPPRVWKIGILQEMSRNSIIPDIDRDNCLASRKIFSAITLAKHPF